jgi:hypothetical protein
VSEPEKFTENLHKACYNLFTPIHTLGFFMAMEAYLVEHAKGLETQKTIPKETIFR